ncbi:MAG TPA: protein kinase [Polyangiaceae bacterium]|nr:protein kinase [Polyangiaceae bacterium]
MFEIGQVIDNKYRVERLVGRGGMGSVFQATHLGIGRRVALKVLELSASPEVEVIMRFEREAQAAARIGNDHILDIFDFGSLPDGARYIVCEFLDGETLAARLARQPMTPAELVPIARQLLNGLSAAHAAGVVHRDLKPDNVFLLRHKAGWADFVKIIDFGISKFQATSGDEAGMRMTATGVVMGTPFYLSPEQARGGADIDHRSDVYSVGVIMYEALTGRVPFQAQNFNELIFKIVLEQAPPPHTVAPQVDRNFSNIVSKAMAREPAERYQSAAELCAAIEGWATAAGLSLSGPIISSGKESGRSASGSTPEVVVRSPTPASWGGTQRESLFVEPRRRTGLIAGAVGLGVMVIAGLAFGLHSLLSFAQEQPSNSSQPSAVVSAPPAPKSPVPEPVLPVEPTPSPVLDLKEFSGLPDAGGLPEAEPPRSFPRPRPAVQHVRPAAGSGTQARPQPAAQPAPEKPTPGKHVDLLGY